MGTTYRGLDKLQPNFSFKVEGFMKEVGNKIFITETRRSQERQDELYAQGRTTPGNIVTWTTKSKHTEGLAIDFAFIGDEMYPQDVGRRLEIYEIAKKYGIANLWEKFYVDKPHLQDDGTTLKEEGKKEEDDFKTHLIKLHKQTSLMLEFLSDSKDSKELMGKCVEYREKVGF